MIFGKSMRRRLAKRRSTENMPSGKEILQIFTNMRCDRMALREIRRVMENEELEDAERVLWIGFILLIRGNPRTAERFGENSLENF